MITDAEGVQFLQWCLPRLHLRWAGFRRVRRQVYKRINRRILELRLKSITDYRDYLEAHPDEWATLDGLCWISISRFYRDQAVFQHLEQEILPQLAQLVITRQENELHCWSAGCSSGEEPYTLAIIWRQRLARQFPSLNLRIIATDIDPCAIERAESGSYRASSLKQLPSQWRDSAFVELHEEFSIKDEYRDAVTLVVQDIRKQVPEGKFQLVLCRNLVFTYFDEISQRETLQRLTGKLTPGGALIIGKLESLPKGKWEVDHWLPHMGIYKKPLAQAAQFVPVSQG